VACYVDRLIDYTGRVAYRHKVWCHLVADSDDELVACADELGVSEAWLQGTRGWDSHFDLPAPLRPVARSLGAIDVDFRFMGRRTRARRAALRLGADQAVGAPAGTTVEVPLPAGDWRLPHAAEGLEVAWRSDHALLPDRTVAVLAAPGAFAGIVTFEPASARSEPAGPRRVAVVLTASATGTEPQAGGGGSGCSGSIGGSTG
jgi:hypothetical protein